MVAAAWSTEETQTYQPEAECTALSTVKRALKEMGFGSSQSLRMSTKNNGASGPRTRQLSNVVWSDESRFAVVGNSGSDPNGSREIGQGSVIVFPGGSSWMAPSIKKRMSNAWPPMARRKSRRTSFFQEVGAYVRHRAPGISSVARSTFGLPKVLILTPTEHAL